MMAEGWNSQSSAGRLRHQQTYPSYLPRSFRYQRESPSPKTRYTGSSHTLTLREWIQSSSTSLLAEDTSRKHLEGDIARRLSISQDRSQAPPGPSHLSATVRGNNDDRKRTQSRPNSWRGSVKRYGAPPPPRANSTRTASRSHRRPSTTRMAGPSSINAGNSPAMAIPDVPKSARPRRAVPQERISPSSTVMKSRGKTSRRRQQQQQQQQQSDFAATSDDLTDMNNATSGLSGSHTSSLLPPPLSSGATGESDGKDDPLSSGLSSWEEFLGVGMTDAPATGLPSVPPTPSPSRRLYSKFDSSIPPRPRTIRTGQSSVPRRSLTDDKASASSTPVPMTKTLLDAIPRPERLPSIQDLFPPEFSKRGSSSSYTSVRNGASAASAARPSSSSRKSLDGVVPPVSDLFYPATVKLNYTYCGDDDGHDDEELPFSAEQPDDLVAGVDVDDDYGDESSQTIDLPRNAFSSRSSTAKQQELLAKKALVKKRSGRKMIRRGMEMLVGGIPINADPPQRCIEITYDASTADPAEGKESSSTKDWARTISLNTLDFGPLLHAPSIPHVTDVERGLYCEHFCHAALKWDVCPKDLRDIVRSHTRQPLPESPAGSREKLSRVEEGPGENAGNLDRGTDVPPTHDEEDDEYNEAMAVHIQSQEVSSASDAQGVDSRTTSRRTAVGKAKGFGKNPNADSAAKGDRQHFVGTTEMGFYLAVSRADLESGRTPEKGDLFKQVLATAFKTVAIQDLTGFTVWVSKLILTDKGEGTNVDVEFKVANDRPMSVAQVQKRLKRITDDVLQAVDDDLLTVAIAACAKLQTGWSREVQDRVVEACMLDLEEAPYEAIDEVVQSSTSNLQPREELYIGGGVGGVFPDYSEKNILNAPYRGAIGLRLVEAVTQRAKERMPRVIAIGDVHGCIDELQDLLRQCDYRPGDLVVFLGDLICKGPDSISVVQMAREIGAIGVRGNHDFEVIRWHQAIKSGVDPPVVGSEHFHIASCLSQADMKWLYSLPWYMSSKELGALFVHAGFVSGIRLAKQNPRLMMNMRSILPDGTVTSKFFNNWPWARLWDGPQTVLFGHDADRGLQQYEHAIGLDTGCVYGGRLTACILPERRLVSVSARREYFKYRRKHYD